MSTQDSTTAQHAFYPTGSSTIDLFDVRAGVPAVLSLEQASCFLASVLEMLQYMAEQPNADVIYGAAHLTAMAKGVIDSVAYGLVLKQMGA